MLARWNPWRELVDLEREMADLTRRVFGTGSLTPLTRPVGGGWLPAVDVFSRGNDLVVKAELPGVDPERDVDISVQDGMLTIRGERRREERTEEESYYRFESAYGAFERSIPLPKGVQEKDIKATYENGILEVVVPKAGELAGAKRIPITVGSGRKALTTRGRKK